MIDYFLTILALTLGVIGLLFLFLGWGFRRTYFRELFLDKKIASMNHQEENGENDETGYNGHLKRTYLKMLGAGFLVLLLGILLFSLKGY